MVLAAAIKSDDKQIEEQSLVGEGNTSNHNRVTND